MHEQVVEDLELDRIHRGGIDVYVVVAGHGPTENQITAVGHRGPPFRLHHRGGRRLDDHGGTVDGVAGQQTTPIEERCLHSTALGHDLVAAEHRGIASRRRLGVGGEPFGAETSPRSHRLGLDGLHNQLVFRGDESEPASVVGLECRRHPRHLSDRHEQSGVGSGVAHPHPSVGRDVVGFHPLSHHLVPAGLYQLLPPPIETGQHVVTERLVHRLLIEVTNVGHADSHGREHTGVGMQHHGLDTESISHQAGVLASGPAETDQRVVRCVVAPLDGDLLDGVGHVLHCDGKEAFGHRLRCLVPTGLGHHPSSQGVETLFDHCVVQGLVTIGPEHGGKEFGSESTQQDVAVGDGQRTAVSIAGRAWIGTGRVGTDPHSGAVEVENRTTTGGHGVNVDHGGPDPETGNLGLAGPFQLARKVGDIGGGAAHVEPDELPEAGGPSSGDHADHTSCRTREQGILASKPMSLGQTAIGLHEHQAPAAGLQRATHPIDVAAENGREIGVDHGGVTPGHQLHQRAHLVTDRNLGKPRLPGQLGQALLVFGIAITVHQAHGCGPAAGLPGPAQPLDHAPFALRGQGLDHLAVSPYALVDLDDLLIDHLRHDDVQIEEPGTGLITDAKGVTEAPGGDQHRGFALVFE